MQDEYTRLQSEEKERVNNYTMRWQSHVDKIVMDKDSERDMLIEEQRVILTTKLEEEQVKVEEAQSLAKKASVSAAIAVAAAETEKITQDTVEVATDEDKKSPEQI